VRRESARRSAVRGGSKAFTAEWRGRWAPRARGRCDGGCLFRLARARRGGAGQRDRQRHCPPPLLVQPVGSRRHVRHTRLGRGGQLSRRVGRAGRCGGRCGPRDSQKAGAPPASSRRARPRRGALPQARLPHRSSRVAPPQARQRHQRQSQQRRSRRGGDDADGGGSHAGDGAADGGEGGGRRRAEQRCSGSITKSQVGSHYGSCTDGTLLSDLATEARERRDLAEIGHLTLLLLFPPTTRRESRSNRRPPLPFPCHPPPTSLLPALCLAAAATGPTRHAAPLTSAPRRCRSRRSLTARPPAPRAQSGGGGRERCGGGRALTLSLPLL